MLHWIALVEVLCAGAEVQRPLATVVIGVIITSTFITVRAKIDNGLRYAYADSLDAFRMITRPHDNPNLAPNKAGWWVRLFVAGLFVFYLNYVPVHLATAAHLNGVRESLAELVFHHDDHHAEHHHSDEHVPHPASDHALTLAAQTQAHGAVTLPVFMFAADIFILLPQPPFLPPPLAFERIRPPGESPPNPLQPRAPPLA
jgi:hypothetical protein